MKPAPFRYYAPRTIDKALAHLAEHGWDAKLLAGGQSLTPMMNFRRDLEVLEMPLSPNRLFELVHGARDMARTPDSEGLFGDL